MVGEISHLEQEIVEPDLKNIYWNWIEVKPEDVILAPNIRSIERESILELAMSIEEVGQLQPCIGDTVETEDGKRVRIIAGQHRYYSIKYLSENGFSDGIMVRCASRTLSPKEVLSIQMSENLQYKMSPEQEAKIIYSFWQESKKAYGDNISLIYLARKMGRSPQKIRDSIKYVEGLSPKIQEMVNKNVLNYSTALLLADKELNSRDSLDQIRDAVFIISRNYSAKQAKLYLRRKKEEQRIEGPLFSGQQWEVMIGQNYKIALNNQAAREGKAAVGWFERIIKTVLLLDNPEKAEFSNAIKSAIKELEVSLDTFYANLKNLGIKF